MLVIKRTLVPLNSLQAELSVKCQSETGIKCFPYIPTNKESEKQGRGACSRGPCTVFIFWLRDERFFGGRARIRSNTVFGTKQLYCGSCNVVKRRKGRLNTTHVHTLFEKSGLATIGELRTVMLDNDNRSL